MKLTNEQAKQEAIKKAYPKVFGKYIDQNGWVDYFFMPYWSYGFKVEDLDLVKFSDFSIDKYRLKILYGIEDNNGWIRIEQDGSNLPPDTHEIRYKSFWQSGDHSKIDEMSANRLIRTFRNGVVTHYKPIKEEPKPIY